MRKGIHLDGIPTVWLLKGPHWPGLYFLLLPSGRVSFLLISQTSCHFFFFNFSFSLLPSGFKQVAISCELTARFKIILPPIPDSLARL